MATDVLPGQASKGSMVGAWWLRSLVRFGLALLAFLLLMLGDDRYGAFLTSSNNGRLDNSLWFASVGWLVVGGVAFAFAAWLPFMKLRYLPSRLFLALIALVPLGHFWWAVLHPQLPVTAWRQFRWFDFPQIQFVCAVLAGVAIASGFRARPNAVAGRERP
jgi:hypothetical protein